MVTVYDHIILPSISQKVIYAEKYNHDNAKPITIKSEVVYSNSAVGLMCEPTHPPEPHLHKDMVFHKANNYRKIFILTAGIVSLLLLCGGSVTVVINQRYNWKNNSFVSEKTIDEHLTEEKSNTSLIETLESTSYSISISEAIITQNSSCDVDEQSQTKTCIHEHDDDSLNGLVAAVVDDVQIQRKMNRKERTNQSSKKMCIKKKRRNSKFNKMFPKKLKMKQIRKFCKKHARKKMAIQNIN